MGMVGQLASVVMDFIADELSTSGKVVSWFFCVLILALIAMNLVVVFINLDLNANRQRLHNLAFAGYVLGIVHFF